MVPSTLGTKSVCGARRGQQGAAERYRARGAGPGPCPRPRGGSPGARPGRGGRVCKSPHSAGAGVLPQPARPLRVLEFRPELATMLQGARESSRLLCGLFNRYTLVLRPDECRFQTAYTQQYSTVSPLGMSPEAGITQGII